jgi:membrane dipeptidase
VIPVIDGHNDALLRVWRTGRSLRDRDDEGCLDLPRMLEGGIAAGFFAVFVPTEDGAPPDPRSLIVRTADGYEVPMEQPLPFERASRVAGEMVSIAERDLFLVRTVADLKRCLAGEETGAILHFEGAEPIEPDLGSLEAWVERGLRSLGVVWSRPNAFGHGVPFLFPGTPDTGPGLTDAGRKLVRACNELGVMIDVAHLNEAGFRNVARLSDRPIVCTHCGVHALAPIPRSLTDEQLDTIRDSGGIAAIVFDTAMTRGDGDLVDDTPIDQILDHIDYVGERIGVEHVALGSDFDGAHPPTVLDDATKVPALLDALAARGWSDDDLRALGHRNWLRVLRDTWL